MKTPRVLAPLVAVAAVAASVALAAPGQARLDAAFRVNAQSFPLEFDPGTNQQSLGIRPLTTQGSVANPPVASYGRAIVLDTGLIEAQFPPPEGSFATCDSVSTNIPDHDEVAAGPVRLEAACSSAPTVSSSLEGVSLVPAGLGGGVLASRTTADGAGDTVGGSVESSITDFEAGPLRIRKVTFRASVAADGRPGGASADWDVDVVGATFDGAPVEVGTGGLTIADQTVPAPPVGDATGGVADQFSSNSQGRFEFRVLAPSTAVAEDGTSAVLRGGGLHLYMASSDDPADRSFFSLTLLGGALSAAVGEAFVDERSVEEQPGSAGVVGSARGGGLTMPAPVSAPPASTNASSGGGAARRSAGQDERSVSSPAAPALELHAASGTRPLPRRSQGWLVTFVVGLAILAAVGASGLRPLTPARNRVSGWWDDTAERFLRG